MKLKRIHIFLIGAVLLGALLTYVDSTDKIAYPMRIIALSLIYVVLATSLNLINGFTGQFSLGHMGFAAVGAYISGIFTTIILKVQAGNPFATPALFGDYGIFIGSMLAGGLAAALVGVLIGFPSLRLRGDYLAIVTLGFGEIIRTILNNIDYVGGPRGLLGIPSMSTFPVIYVVAVLTVLVIRNIVYSTHGRALLSIRENELAADLCGIDTTRYKVISFAIGAFFAGIGGALLAHLINIAHPLQYGFMGSVMILIMVYVGGMGSISGSVMAAFGLTIMTEVLKNGIAFISDTTGWSIGQEWVMVVYSILLILVMLFKNEGIMGMREVKLLVPEEESA